MGYKLKDNINLDELKKYGYEINLQTKLAFKKIDLGFDKHGDFHSIMILINANEDKIIKFKHEINFYIGYSSNFIKLSFLKKRKYLKDLIKANLIEKNKLGINET